jgi:hypothetical protein
MNPIKIVFLTFIVQGNQQDDLTVKSSGYPVSSLCVNINPAFNSHHITLAVGGMSYIICMEHSGRGINSFICAMKKLSAKRI